jgi:hypothetical protein
MSRKTISNRSRREIMPTINTKTSKRNKIKKNKSLLESDQSNEPEDIDTEILNSREPPKIPNETYEPPVLNPVY